MWNYSIKNYISINLFIALTTPTNQIPIVRFAATRQSTIPSSYGSVGRTALFIGLSAPSEKKNPIHSPRSIAQGLKV